MDIRYVYKRRVEEPPRTLPKDFIRYNFTERSITPDWAIEAFKKKFPDGKIRCSSDTFEHFVKDTRIRSVGLNAMIDNVDVFILVKRSRDGEIYVFSIYLIFKFRDDSTHIHSYARVNTVSSGEPSLSKWGLEIHNTLYNTYCANSEYMFDMVGT